MKVLITSGGTREHIDAARVLTNTSTGRTGRVLAEELAARGCEVLALCAAGSQTPSGRNVRTAGYETFSDLDSALKKALKSGAFDAVIHLAAVSDYSPVLIEAGGRRYKPGRAAKLPSSPATLRITLRRNFKIVDRIKPYAAAGRRPAPLLIAFKLTAGATKTQALKKVRSLPSADLVVHNDTREMKDPHLFHIYSLGLPLADCAGPEILAEKLFQLLNKREQIHRLIPPGMTREVDKQNPAGGPSLHKREGRGGEGRARCARPCFCVPLPAADRQTAKKDKSCC